MYQPNRLIPDDFAIDPSRRRSVNAGFVVVPTVDAVAYPVPAQGDVPDGLQLGRDALAAAGFTGRLGQSLAVPAPGGELRIAVGVGDPATLTVAGVRDLAAVAARAAGNLSAVALDMRGAARHLDAEAVATALVEGAVLARYRYDALKNSPATTPLERLELVGEGSAGAVERGLVLARAGMLARDLSAAPPAHLTATRFAEYAAEVGPQHGLEVTIFDKQQLIELGCGGLLGVNAGSVEEPRMIQLRYRPKGASAHLAFVGKGIMYDSGGIALKPGDAMHASMKMDMAGAAAVFSAMLALRELGCTTNVTGYLMCTDNMPSGSATALGDVLHMYGGKTVEVKNTDAEGRLVMADAITLANEEGVDAIVDIATLTGAALRSLGTLTAPVFGNDDDLVERVRAAAESTGEDVWRLPLERRYRDQLNSDVADLSNIGGPNAGATIAALFLAEFVGKTPWAHLDIAGTMQSDKDDVWRSKGPTGFGARLLAELAVSFSN